MALDLPFRQIHLDFHTGPQIPDVGRDFDADAFAEALDAARVNSVTLFAKCHHGHLYYDTKHPARHPGLKPGLDLLGAQIEACRRRGIRTPIYLSVQCDEYAAREHPEWLALKPDGGSVGAGPLGAGWHILDMSSPYADYMAEQIAEVMRKFRPVDEVFLDMCWDQPSVSKWACDAMRRGGLDPQSEEDRRRYAVDLSMRYMARYKKLIDDLGRGGRRGKGGGVASGGGGTPTFFNSRPLSNLAREKKFLQHVEIEALPSGGWGYAYFPINVRYVRTLGLPYLGMTARFHKSWADFGGLKPEAALRYECAQMLAHGAKCSVGDQLHPRGRLDAAAYELIGKVFRHVEEREPWCEGAEAVTQIAVVRRTDGNYHSPPGGADEGAMRALQQLRHQFDFVGPDADLGRYELVVIAESVRIDAGLRDRLRAYLGAGGALLVAGAAAVDDAGRPALPELGIAAEGESPFTTTYLRLGPEIADAGAAADHVVYERGLRLRPAGKARALAGVVEPYFERTWEHFSSHFQTPGDKLSPYAAAVQHRRCITLAYPLFGAYATHGNLPLRDLLGRCIDRLLPEPLLRVGGPSFLEATVTRQRARKDANHGPGRPARTIVHLVSFCPQRRTPTLDLVEEPTPLLDVPVSLRLDRAPRRVTLEPGSTPLEFAYRGGRAEVRVTHDLGHAMIVFA